jgi:hypothetical protein
MLVYKQRHILLALNADILCMNAHTRALALRVRTALVEMATATRRTCLKQSGASCV